MIVDDGFLEDINLMIATLALAGACCVVVICSFWLKNLDSRRTNLKPIFLSVTIFALGSGFWSFQGILQLLYFKMDIPATTMPSRLGLMIAPFIALWCMLRIKPPPRLHNIPGAFKKRKSDLNGNRLKVILIVEDDLDLAELYQDALDSNRFAVEIVWNGEAGLIAIERYEPDLIIVDIKLPGINGIQFLALARMAGFKGKAIGVSGLIDSIEKEKLSDFSVVLQKPFKINDLISVIEELIHGDNR